MKRKIVGEEIKAIQKEKILAATNNDPSKDADKYALDAAMYTKYALDAAKKKNFQLLERTNDLWSLVEAKEDELQELDKMEEIFLLEKRISRKV